MVLVRKCCFVIPLKQAVIIIGLVSMVLSFIGILFSSGCMLNLIQPPSDVLLKWLLEVSFLSGVHAIVFQSILFLVSTILLCGILTNIPPLLVPWLGWSPFLITGVLIQVILVIVKKPDLALPLMSFSIMLALLIIYSTIIIVAYYREVMTPPIQLRLFNIRDGELPRIVEIPQRLVDRCRWNTSSAVSGGVPSPSTIRSDRPLPVDPSTRAHSGREDVRQRLREAYARFLAASMLNRASRQTTEQEGRY